MSDAIDLMLGVFRQPARSALLPARELPDGVLDVIRIAAGDEEAIAAARASTALDPADLDMAAGLLLNQLLFFDGADSYRTLGVSAQADTAQIKRHYRWLVRWLHPDRNPDNLHAVFTDRINHAWNSLRTAERRRAYDEHLRAAQDAPAAAAHAVPGSPLLHEWAAPAPAPLLSARAVRRLPQIIVSAAVLVALVVLGLGVWTASLTRAPVPPVPVAHPATASPPAVPTLLAAAHAVPPVTATSAAVPPAALVAAPAVTGPAVTGPAVMGPAVMGPAVTGPAVMGPAVMGPAVTGPAVTGPAVTGPAVTGPAVTGPAVTGPAVTGPAVTGPAVTGPAVTGPAVMGPAVVEPAVVEPALVESVTTPAATTPAVNTSAAPPAVIAAAAAPRAKASHPVSVAEPPLRRNLAKADSGPSFAAAATPLASTASAPAAPLPATAAATLSGGDLRDFVERFQRLYAADDVEGFLALFSAQAQGNNRSDYAGLAVDYRRLFAQRRLRTLALSDLRWEIDGDQAAGNGHYEAWVGPGAGRPGRRTQGRIMLQLTRGADGLRILQLHHTVSE